MNKPLLCAALVGAGLIVGAGHSWADEMPDVLVGNWKENVIGKFPNGTDEIDELWAHTNESITPYYGYMIEKDKYSIMDFDCTVLHVEKQADALYTVQAHCQLAGGGPNDPPEDEHIETKEFELLKNGKLKVTPVEGPEPPPPANYNAGEPPGGDYNGGAPPEALPDADPSNGDLL